MKNGLVGLALVLAFASPAMTGEAPRLVVEPGQFLYQEEAFQFTVSNPDGRLEFYVRRLVESGEQKAPFDRWVGRGEFARVVDPRGISNISFLILKKDTPEVAMTNLLKRYTEDLVYFEKERARTEVSPVATKETVELNINRYWRRVTFGWLRLTPAEHPILFVWVYNRGTYDKEVDKVLDGVLLSIRLRTGEKTSPR